MEEDSILTDEKQEEVESDPKGRNAVIQSILDRNFGPQEEIVEPDPIPDNTPDITPDPEEYTLKVLGQEVKATKDKVIDAGIRTLQKESAADERLRVASKKEQEIEQRLAELKQIEDNLFKRKDVEPDAIGREFAEAILTDDEKVASVITGITSKITELEKEVATTRKTRKAEQEATFKNIVKHYNETFNDIANDPAMHTVFNMFRKDVLKSESDPFKATEEAAKMVYQKFGVTKEPPPPEPTITDIKRGLNPQPRKASARVKTPDPPKTKTQAEILDDVRRGRSMR